MSKVRHKVKIGSKTKEAHFGVGFIEKVNLKHRPDYPITKDFDKKKKEVIEREWSIMDVSTTDLIHDAFEYSDERNGRETELSKYDINDLIDEGKITQNEIKKFQIALIESMETFIEDEEVKKSAKEVVEVLKKSLNQEKTGAKDGKKK